MNQVIIKGYKYDVLGSKPSVSGNGTEFYLAKPKGKIVYWAIKYSGKFGAFCDPVSMGVFNVTREVFKMP